MREEACFLINSRLRKDINVDMNGSWKLERTKTTFIKKDTYQTVVKNRGQYICSVRNKKTYKRELIQENDVFKGEKKDISNRSDTNFKKMVYFLTDCSTDECFPILVNYSFLKGHEIAKDFKIKAHGNSLTDTPFQPTAKSTKEEIKSVLRESNANVGRIYRKLAANSIDNENSIHRSPRNRRQIYYEKYKMADHTTKPEDEISAVLKQLIKERSAEENKFLQSVIVNKYPVIVFFNQQQIEAVSYTHLTLPTILLV